MLRAAQKSMEGLVEAVPRGAIIFGAAGLIPYFATSATTIFLARNAWLADQGAGALRLTRTRRFTRSRALT